MDNGQSINGALVTKKIKEAGWASRLFGFGLFLFAMAMILVPNLKYPLIIVVIVMAFTSMLIGNKLYKENLPVGRVREYLKILIFVLIPTITSLIGIIVLWYVLVALNSINACYGKFDSLNGCPDCGNNCNFKKDLKCEKCGRVFWSSKEKLDEYRNKFAL